MLTLKQRTKLRKLLMADSDEGNTQTVKIVVIPASTFPEGLLTITATVDTTMLKGLTSLVFFSPRQVEKALGELGIEEYTLSAPTVCVHYDEVEFEVYVHLD